MRQSEEISYLAHVSIVWKKQAGRLFHSFRVLCLDPMSELAEFYPCLQSEACTFRVIRQPGQAIIGQFERDPRGCPHITLTEPDITPLEFNWQKFGRALCRALNLEYKYRRMPIFQIQCLREFISPHSLLTLAAHSSRRPDYFKH